MSIPKVQPSQGRALVAKPTLAKELDTTSRTVDRWASDPAMKFPKPIKMARRVYFFRDEIEAWKLSRVRASIAEAA
jgi:predicted DNA-binding transcriptional regulator AlpA